ncbi:MAG: hypothetical protein ABEJ57_07505 [Halobacteriaceae archaeon]
MRLGAPTNGPAIDYRAIGSAVLAEAGVAALIVIGSLPVVAHLVLPVVGATLAGVLSRNYEEEFMDGAIAAGAAPVTAIVVALATSWLITPGISGQLAVNLGSIIFSVALPVVLLATTMSAIIGAVLSHQVASIHRRAAEDIEIA